MTLAVDLGRKATKQTNGTLADNEDPDEMPHKHAVFGLNVILSVTVHFKCSVARCLINFVYLAPCAFIRS